MIIDLFKKLFKLKNDIGIKELEKKLSFEKN